MVYSVRLLMRNDYVTVQIKLVDFFCKKKKKLVSYIYIYIDLGELFDSRATYL